MAIIVSTRVDHDTATDYFEYAGYRARNLRSPLTRTGHAISHFVNQNFAEEGALVGGWEDYTEGYIKWKDKHAPGRSMLVLTGKMRTAAISNRAWTIRGNHQLVYRPRRWKGGEMGLDLVDVHMTGRSGGRGGRMPARQIFAITPAFREQVDAIFRDWLDTLRTRNVRRGPVGVAPAGPDLVFFY